MKTIALLLAGALMFIQPQKELKLLYNLQPLEQAFIQAEEEHGVKAEFLAAVAALESGWGRYCFKKNNIFGFGAKEFATKEECINHVAKFLADEYLRPAGAYFEGLTVEDINKHYNGKEEWKKEVVKLMHQIRGEKCGKCVCNPVVKTEAAAKGE